MPGEDAPGVWVGFAKGCELEAGAFEPEGETADAAEEIKEAHKDDLGISS